VNDGDNEKPQKRKAVFPRPPEMLKVVISKLIGMLSKNIIHISANEVYLRY